MSPAVAHHKAHQLNTLKKLLFVMIIINKYDCFHWGFIACCDEWK